MMWVKLNKTEFKVGMIICTGDSYLYRTEKGLLYRGETPFNEQYVGMHEHWFAKLSAGHEDGGFLIADEVENVTAANAIIDFVESKDPRTGEMSTKFSNIRNDAAQLRKMLGAKRDLRIDFYNVLPELTDQTFPVGSVVLAGRLLLLWREDENTVMKFCFVEGEYRPTQCKARIESHMNNGKPAIKIGLAETASQFAEVAHDFYMNVTANVADEMVRRLGCNKDDVDTKIIVQTQPKPENVKFANLIEKVEQQAIEFDAETMKGGDMVMIGGVIMYRHPLTMKVGAVVYDDELGFQTANDLVSGIDHNHLIAEKQHGYGIIRKAPEAIANIAADSLMKDITKRNSHQIGRFDEMVKAFAE